MSCSFEILNNLSISSNVRSTESPLSINWSDEVPITSFSHEFSLLSAVSFLTLMAMLTVWTVRQLFRSKSTNEIHSVNKIEFISAALLLMLACELPIFLSTPKEGLVDLIQGTDPLLNEILARVPSIQQGPSPPLLLRNRHVQFIPWLLQNEIHRRQGIPYQRVEVEVSDCMSKLQTCQATMNDTLTLDIFPPFDASYEGFNKSSPVILYAPGLQSHSQDLPGNGIVRRAFGAGFRSIVVHRRGHTPNQRLKSPRWNLFGDVDDLEQVFWYIKKHLVTADTAFFLHGISAGTAVTVTALSKWDRRRVAEPEKPTPAIVASLDLTPGYDISKVLLRERFLWPYNDLLMQGVKDHFVVSNEELLRAHDNGTVDRLLNATSLQEIVDIGVIFAGYENTTQYYEDSNPINALKDILTPKLVLNAVDDPCCNIENLYEQSPYPQHEGKTFAQMIRETKRGIVAVTYTGSHCPFICTRNRWLPVVEDPYTGGYMLNSWADQVAVEYYRAAFDVYGSRRFL